MLKLDRNSRKGMTKIIRELRNTEGNRIYAIRKEREARSLKAEKNQLEWDRKHGKRQWGRGTNDNKVWHTCRVTRMKSVTLYANLKNNKNKTICLNFKELQSCAQEEPSDLPTSASLLSFLFFYYTKLDPLALICLCPLLPWTSGEQRSESTDWIRQATFRCDLLRRPPREGQQHLVEFIPNSQPERSSSLLQACVLSDQELPVPR